MSQIISANTGGGGAGIVSVTGTANQVTASTLLGAVTISTPAIFIAPGTIEATTSVEANTNFLLPTTSATAGQITINAVPVIHAYGGNPGQANYEENLYIGGYSGNFTQTVAVNRGGNVGAGYKTLNAIAQGFNNTAIGHYALQLLEGSGDNSGYRNTAVGFSAGGQLSNPTDTDPNGSLNIMIGSQAGYSYTQNEHCNICIGNAGVITDSHKIRIGTQGTGAGQQDTTFIAGIHGVTPGGASIEMAVIDANGQLGSQAIPSAGGIGTLDGDSGTATGATVTIAGTTDQITTTGDNSATVTIALATSPTVTGTWTTTAGNIEIPTSSSTAGQITQNGAVLLHTQGGETGNDIFTNLFLGKNAGNFTHSTATNYGGDIGIGGLTLANAAFGGENFALGYKALYSLIGTPQAGARNVAIGRYSMGNIIGTSTTDYEATYNIAIGYAAGYYLNASEYNNIYFNHAGVAGESAVLRIGDGTGATAAACLGTRNLTKAFISGIVGITTDANDAIPVLISSTGQLGTVSSSIRYKENIEDLKEVTSELMSLRPVTFNYKEHKDGKKNIGLIAEEVDKVIPDIVVKNKDGECETIQYHLLPIMLLKEIQSLNKRIAVLESKGL